MSAIMNFKVTAIFLLACILFPWVTFAQSPIARFTADQQVCLNQNILLTNASDNATSFQWDFCFDDLNQVKEINSQQTVASAQTPTGINFFRDGNKYYGFVSSRDNNKLIRLDYQSSLENVPEAVDLGNIENLLQGPQSMAFFKEAGIVYAILTNYNGANLLRLSFLDGIESAPVAEDLGNLGLVAPRGIDLTISGNNIIVSIADDTGQKLSLINFGSSITNNPSISDVLNIPIDGGARPIGVQLLKTESDWFAFVSLYATGKIMRVNFGSLLSSSVTFDDIYSVANPTELSLVQEGVVNHLFVATASGNLHHLIAPELSVDNISAVNLGRLNILSNTFGFCVVRSAPIWYAFAINYESTLVTKIKFEGDCTDNISLNETSDLSPASLIYKLPGKYPIELTAATISDENVFTDTVQVVDLPAPDIIIGSDNICVGSLVTFHATETSGMQLTSWDWSLDNNVISVSPAPSNTYNAAGNYLIQVRAAASNGCKNIKSQQLQIYNSPVASFDFPQSGATLCTNQAYQLQNLSTFDNGSQPTWKWSIDSQEFSEDQSPLAIFSGTGDHEVKLTIAIPGCSNEFALTIFNLKNGPLVDFTITGACEQEEITFTNQSSGDISSYLWKVENLFQTHQKDTSLVLNPGAYAVQLAVTGTNGCVNAVSRDLTIHALPTAAFEISSADKLCANSAVTVADKSISADTELASWQWTYGDGNSDNLLSNGNTTHTYSNAGSYVLGLSVKTAAGCQQYSEKQLIVKPLPDASFTHSLICIGDPVTFQASNVGIQSYSWKIDNKIYTGVKPVHTFRGSGQSAVDLTVKSNNGCENSMNAFVNVPVVLVPDFTVINNCTDYPARFTDATTGGDDVAVSWNWTIDQNVKEGTEIDYTFDEEGDQSVLLSVTSASGCTYYKTKTITVVPPPTSEFSMPAPIGTPPLAVDFTNNSKNANTFLWDFKDGSPPSSGFAPQHAFNDLGQFDIELIASNDQGCIDKSTKRLTLTPANPDVNILAISTAENPDGSNKIMVTLENDGNTILQNLPVQVDISGSINLKEIVTGPIMPLKRFTVTLGYGLQLNKNIEFLCAEALLDNDKNTDANRNCIQFEKQLVIRPSYPNPATDKMAIEWISNESSGSVAVSLIDSHGQKVWHDQFDSFKGLNQKVIAVNELHRGIYLLVIESKSLKTVQRILLAH
jgi:PKD repeat protein